MMRRALSLLLDPVTGEKRSLLRERWSSLPDSVRIPGQGLGRKATGCGATIGVKPKCDFACTGCYLGAEANRIPELPLERVLQQLDELRAWLGPKSNVQLTDGEVTLRPIEELAAILRHCRSIGIIPMLMTHGDTFRRRPGMLERLVEEGLTEVSIHVDTTQRGRDGYRAPASEGELMPLRDEFAEMVREVRRRTGRRLRAATTLTISSDNLAGVADVTRWLIRNRDAFGLVSFQPLAQVGRTRSHLRGVTADELWAEVGKATADFGATLASTGPMHFGHTECTRFVPLIAVERDGETRLLQFIRDEKEDIDVMEEYFETGLAGAAFRDDSPLEMIARGAGMIAREPRWMFGRALPWVDRRLHDEIGTGFLRLFVSALARRTRVDGVTLTSHHFMSPAELSTEVGKERLAACVFRLPIDGEMVPMCRVNAGGVREQVYASLSRGPVPPMVAPGPSLAKVAAPQD
jgi:MoaA/NifB/PqqE/SkfB family radical SAM enzyme